MTSSTTYSDSDDILDPKTRMMSSGIPRISVNPWNHKTAIAIYFIALMLTSSFIPIILFYVLSLGAGLSLSISLAVPSATFGVFSLFSLCRRTWMLMKKDSNCRPLGASRGAMDFFNWNFIAGFCALTALISAGNALTAVRVSALGIPILIIEVSIQLLLVAAGYSMGIKAPFRISSIAKGEPLRPASYTLAEDIMAVDSQQGQLYRRQLNDRYLASPHIRTLLFRLDLLWGIGGLVTGALLLGLVFGLSDNFIGFGLAFGLPWVYVGLFSTISIAMTRAAKAKESSAASFQRIPVQETSYSNAC